MHCVLCAVHQVWWLCCCLPVFLDETKWYSTVTFVFYFKLMLKVNTKEGLGEETKIIYLFLDVECENYANEYSSIKP
jgi:hypothetical protein